MNATGVRVCVVCGRRREVSSGVSRVSIDLQEPEIQ